MVKDALSIELTLYRPSKASGYNGTVTYTLAQLASVKLAQPTKGWTVDTAGSVSANTATLYYNVGQSSQSPVLSPLFKEGDIITPKSTETTPSADDRLVVQAVTEQSFKGKLHHYEVVLT